MKSFSRRSIGYAYHKPVKVFIIGLSYSDDARDSQIGQLMDEFAKISGFNYRIARHKVGDDAYYRIHECFYDENGKVVLWGESSPHGETADALIADLEQMLADAKRSRDDIFDVPPDQT